jgi:hypothetical protein
VFPKVKQDESHPGETDITRMIFYFQWKIIPLPDVSFHSTLYHERKQILAMRKAYYE